MRRPRLTKMSPDDCPVRLTTDVIGGKWKPLILYFLKGGTQRFGELHREVVGVTRKMLTQQLRELEHDDIVARKIYAEVPPRVDYSLTKHGKTLAPILDLMCAWGVDHRKRYGLPSRNAGGGAKT